MQRYFNKRIVSFLILVFISGIIYTVEAAETKVEALATPIFITDFPGSKQVVFSGFKLNGERYYKLRDFAYYLSYSNFRFNLIWHGDTSTTEIIPGEMCLMPDMYKTANISFNGDNYVTPTVCKILIGGQVKNYNAYLKDGSVYLNFKDMLEFLPFKAEYRYVKDKLPTSSYYELYENGLDDSAIILSKGLPANSIAVNVDKIVETGNYAGKFYLNYVETPFPVLYKEQNDAVISINLRQDKLVPVDGRRYVYIEKFDKTFKKIWQKELDFELPLYGGFYSGDKYNYIVFGDYNADESNAKEIIRVVRYTKSFERIDSCSVSNAFTIEPFCAGTVRMAEKGNTLVVHTSRLRYLTSDGLNHQSNLTVVIDTGQMRVVNELSEFQPNHVGHSFDQFALFDGDDIVLLDLGDGYPRAVVLNKGAALSSLGGATDFNYSSVPLYEIPGEIGENYTGVSIGGIEQSSSSYIFTFNSSNFTKPQAGSAEQRNIMLASVPKATLSSGAVKRKVIETYIGTDKIASVPQIVKINNDKFIVLWQEISSAEEMYAWQNMPIGVKYAYIDGTGKKMGNIEFIENAALSNYKPTVFGDSVVWFVNRISSDILNEKVFYRIPIK